MVASAEAPDIENENPSVKANWLVGWPKSSDVAKERPATTRKSATAATTLPHRTRPNENIFWRKSRRRGRLPDVVTNPTAMTAGEHSPHSMSARATSDDPSWAAGIQNAQVAAKARR